MERIETIPALPARPIDGHKGTFGRVAIVGGSAGSMPDAARMIGAPALCAHGAIRAGCGLVRIAAPQPILDEILAISPFATGYPIPVGADADLIAHESAPIIDRLVLENNALIIGPGLGVPRFGSDSGITKLVVRCVVQEDIPTVVDADAITALCSIPEFTQDLRAPAIFTPHPGEADRLCAALSIPGEPAGDDEQRSDVCARLAQRLGAIVVLKGARTVVSDGQRVWACTHGHPCMAVGGTGDVLAGIIGSIVAQNTHNPEIDLFGSAQIAVNTHALAGEAWAHQNNSSGGMIATELAERVPAIIEQLRKDRH